MSYTISSIVINQREVSLSEILSGKATPTSPFEAETFAFIREWLSGTSSFTLNTSGSTGTPKEITLARRQLQQSAHRTITALSLNKNDTVFVCLDTKYIAGKMMLVRALEGNMNIVAVEPSSAPLSTNHHTKIDFAAFVPLQLLEMLKHEDCTKKLNEMKAIIVGGAAIPTALLQECKKLTCRVYATYGMTETVSHIALQQLNGERASDNFTVLPGISIEQDTRNCLVIQLPEFTGKIITNDIVELTGGNQFRWLGRYDNIVNSGGHKISPEKIEQVLEQIIPKSRSFFLTGIADDRLGEKLVLIVEGESTKISLADTPLHPYEVPKEIIYLPQFIRTETGKINRSKTKLLAISQ